MNGKKLRRMKEKGHQDKVTGIGGRNNGLQANGGLGSVIDLNEVHDMEVMPELLKRRRSFLTRC